MKLWPKHSLSLTLFVFTLALISSCNPEEDLGPHSVALSVYSIGQKNSDFCKNGGKIEIRGKFDPTPWSTEGDKLLPGYKRMPCNDLDVHITYFRAYGNLSAEIGKWNDDCTVSFSPPLVFEGPLSDYTIRFNIKDKRDTNNNYKRDLDLGCNDLP